MNDNITVNFHVDRFRQFLHDTEQCIEEVSMLDQSHHLLHDTEQCIGEAVPNSISPSNSPQSQFRSAPRGPRLTATRACGRLVVPAAAVPQLLLVAPGWLIALHQPPFQLKYDETSAHTAVSHEDESEVSDQPTPTGCPTSSPRQG
jgi:hypothetical protein